MSIIVNVHEVKARLSRLIDQAHAGEEIIIAKAGKPFVRLVPLAPETRQRTPGRLKGRLGDEFFEVLPEDELLAGIE